MILFSLIVGVFAAYHFGLRNGMIAAGVTAALLFATLIMPTMAFKIYGVVAVGVTGIAVVGPRLKRNEARPVKRGFRAALKIGRRLVNQIKR